MASVVRKGTQVKEDGLVWMGLAVTLGKMVSLGYLEQRVRKANRGFHVNAYIVRRVMLVSLVQEVRWACQDLMEVMVKKEREGNLGLQEGRETLAREGPQDLQDRGA